MKTGSRAKPPVLILGGTSEARALAAALEAGDLAVPVTSFAGRTESPAPVPGDHRIGGFGGPEGLAAWLVEHRITALIDATHPFALTIGDNAVTAARTAGIPALRLTRAQWTPRPGDVWIDVGDGEAGNAVLAQDPPSGTAILVALGAQRLESLYPAVREREDLRWRVRVVDPPAAPYPSQAMTPIIDRGPFNTEAEHFLFEREGVSVVLARNAGGDASVAKIVVARRLGLPIVMIRRPPGADPQHACHSVKDLEAQLRRLL